MNKRARRLCSALAASLLGGGCAVGPDYRRPTVDVPSGWKAGAHDSRPGTANTALWWQNFQDPTLSKLVADALQGNFDLQLSEARLRQARAARGVIAGGLLPAVTASGAALRGSNAPSSTSGQTFTGNAFQAGLDAVWAEANTAHAARMTTARIVICESLLRSDSGRETCAPGPGL